MSITNLGAPSNPATGQISDVYTYFPPITSARAGRTPAFSMAGTENYATLRRFIIEPKARLGIIEGATSCTVSKTNRTLASVCREQA